jgi:hypothetical protein
MWDWAVILGVIGVGLGVPALAVAIPPFFQMMWGRPQLEIQFVEFTGTDGKDLMCSILNKPVKNRFLKAVGVRRDSGDLNASFDLLEEGSGKLLLRAMTANIHDATARVNALVVRSRPHFHCGFSVILCRDNKTFVHDPRQQALIEIPSGHYRARVLVVCDDQPYVVQKAMQLDANPVNTCWI